jgi:hypothetical protein
VSLLEEWLRGSPAKALRETSGMADAAQKVGGMRTGLFGFENQVETSKAALEIWKKESANLGNLLSESSLAGRLGMNKNENKFKEWVDFSLLPSWDRISKYFSITVWAGNVSADGVTFKVYSPTPPAMKKG